MQGHLRNEPVSVAITTECDHCSRTLEIEVNSELEYRVLEGEAPLVLYPIVDFGKIEDPSIIHAF